MVHCKRKALCNRIALHSRLGFFIYLNPYTRDPKNNPTTFVAVGEHDFLKLETLGYAAKLHKAGVDTTAVLYKGLGHAFFDNTGVYPQCEDCIDEMIAFIKKHS